MFEEGRHPSRDEVAGGLVAGHREKEEEQLQLHLVQLLPLDLDLGEHAHQIVAGIGPLGGEQPGRVGIELHSGLLGDLALGLVLGVLAADHAVGPVEHPVPVLVGDAEQIGDDDQGELGGDVGDEVGLPRLDHRVDDVVGGLVDVLVKLVDHPRREALVDQSPVAGVEGRVHVEHEHLLLGQVVIAQLPEERGLPRR